MPHWTPEQLAEYERKRVSQIGNVEFVDAVGGPSCKAASIRPRRLATASPLYQLVGMCRCAGLPEPTPEYEFHPTRKFRFDYAFVSHRLAVEIEGGIWKRGGGAHSHPLNIERDIEKYNEAAILGWRILRVVPERWMDAVALIQRALGEDKEVA